ncbi:MAG: GGDEF domain-containing protein [Pyrinomonadaceae bacterium]|nr:GGDEF domain-containing protein [Pyrinomonadaceae bacterium]
MSKLPQKYDNLKVAVSVLTGIAVFLIAVSGFSLTLRIAVSIVVVIAGAVILKYVFASDAASTGEAPEPNDLEDRQLFVDELETLEEAAVYFAASMEPEEMLRLVAARLSKGGVKGVEFYLVDVKDGLSRVGPQADGEYRPLKHLAFKAFTNAAFVHEDAGRTGLFEAAMPLQRGTEILAVIAVAHSKEINEEDLRAVVTRIEPLIANSISFATSVTNALKDSLTGLPNERAMHLILENQVAESERFGPDRPLSTVALDISSFEAINRKFGHSTGDRLLEFVAERITDQLRKMDFVARIKNDEFLMILPKAGKEDAESVVQRIKADFEVVPFEQPGTQNLTVKLNHGTATFGDDADSAPELLQTAKERKQVGKGRDKGSVIKFPGSQDS